VQQRERDLPRTLDLVCSAHSDYLLRVLAASGVEWDAFRSLSDIELISPIDKAIFTAECETFTREAATRDAALAARTVWQLMGTAGRPTPFVD
jgi:hypothetical protein